MNTTQNNAPMDRIKRWAPLVIIIACLVAAYAAGLQNYISLSTLVENRAALGEFVASNIVTSTLGFIVIYAILVALSFPGATLMTLTAGLLFGGIFGGIITVIAATIGATVIFLVARSSLGEFLSNKAGPFVNKMIDGFQNDAFQYLLTIRLTPVFPFWAVNIVPALLNMKLREYVLATFIGIIPATFVFAYIGAGLDSILAKVREEQPGCGAAGNCTFDFGSLVTAEILIALGGLAAISILPLIVRKLRGEKTSVGKNGTA